MKKITLMMLAILIATLMTVSVSAQACGDGICEPWESDPADAAGYCPEDCGVTSTCELDESCYDYNGGPCDATLGNAYRSDTGECYLGEGCLAGSICYDAPSCDYNGECEPHEDPASCSDCFDEGYCGDGICEPWESDPADSRYCLLDCGDQGQCVQGQGCAADHECYGGLCVFDGSTHCQYNGNPCSSPQDCSQTNQVCIIESGICEDTAEPCTTDDECPTAVCLAGDQGYCGLTGDPCQLSSDCPVVQEACIQTGGFCQCSDGEVPEQCQFDTQVCGNGILEQCDPTIDLGCANSEECDDGNTLPGDGCSEICQEECTDNDGDGYYVQGGECGPVDCNDENSEVNPGASEACDGYDNNCDGAVDDVDADNDLVNDCHDDKCLGSQADIAGSEGLRPNHYRVEELDGQLQWVSNIGSQSVAEIVPAQISMSETNGCGCDEILLCKPGANSGEIKFGCTGGPNALGDIATVGLFRSQSGWAEAGVCFDSNGIVEGESKPLLTDTDEAGWVDAIDTDNDNDGVSDASDSLVDDADPEGSPGHGKPDWWEAKHNK